MRLESGIVENVRFWCICGVDCVAKTIQRVSGFYFILFLFFRFVRSFVQSIRSVFHATFFFFILYIFSFRRCASILMA